MILKSWPLAAVAAVLCATGIASGQSTHVKDLRVGKLLVAARDLPDPDFAQSVILLVHYDHEGAVGLMLNRRTRATISRVIQDLDTGKRGSDPIYVGGPVEMSVVMGLLKSQQKPEEADSVLSDVYLVSTKALLQKSLAGSSGPSDLRLYLGYCGWGGGQLENEMQAGGWWIFDADVGVVFDPDPGSIWSRFIARTERLNAQSEPGALHRAGSGR